MNILYIALSCNPYRGSEDKIGWEIPRQSAKQNRVHVITIEQQRRDIERYMKENPQENLHFYYVDIPSVLKKLYAGPFFTGRLNALHRYALPVAREICEKHDIAIIHQITPIEFRSIGDYGKIPNVKYVCGPLGAGQVIPKCLMGYMGKKAMVEQVRSLANYISLWLLKINKKMQRCDYLLFVNQETVDFLQPVIGDVPYSLCFDNGIREAELENKTE